ncbi:MAG TPA: flagellar motor switch protein FliN [Actinomycetales bacterium]|jgi:flagellar motor switch protein FliN/FliY
MSTITRFEDDVVTAARQAAAIVPSQSPLTAGAPTGLAVVQSQLPPDAVAVHADVRGQRPGRVVLVVQAPLAAALADSPMGPLPLTDALRPVLEALSGSLGVGVLGQVVETSAQEALALLAGQESAVVPLSDVTGTTAWVAVGTSAGGVGAAAPAGAFSGQGMELLQDVVMELTAELGRTTMTVRDLLNLQPGAVVELDRLAGSPADLLVNGRLIARGEVVIVDEDYALKIIELLSGPTSGRE